MPAPQYASITPQPVTDGVDYAVLVPMPAAEGSLFNQTPPAAPEIPVAYNQAVVASVSFSTQGTVSSNASYVVLQGDMGDGKWFDLAWCDWAGTTGTSAVNVLAAGAFAGASLPAARASGTAPTPVNSSVQMPLPARLRFVGKGTVAGGGSALVSIRYKLLGLR